MWPFYCRFKLWDRPAPRHYLIYVECTYDLYVYIHIHMHIHTYMNPLLYICKSFIHIHTFMFAGSVEGGWGSITDELALKYAESGYPEIAEFIKS